MPMVFYVMTLTHSTSHRQASRQEARVPFRRVGHLEERVGEPLQDVVVVPDVDAHAVGQDYPTVDVVLHSMTFKRASVCWAAVAMRWSSSL